MEDSRNEGLETWGALWTPEKMRAPISKALTIFKMLCSAWRVKEFSSIHHDDWQLIISQIFRPSDPEERQEISLLGKSTGHRMTWCLEQGGESEGHETIRSQGLP